MSNSDILSKADKALRPVLKGLGRFSWVRIEGCCAGHKPEDSLWIEVNVLGSSGLSRLMELLRMLDAKLADTDIRVDCLLSYAGRVGVGAVGEGWGGRGVGGLGGGGGWGGGGESMIIETLLSSIEEFSSRSAEPNTPQGAINYC